MNTLAATPTYALSTKRTLWLLSLSIPAVIGPLWCLAWYGSAHPLSTMSGLVLVWLLVASSVTDLSCRKIYNWATYSAAIWALAINSAGEWLGPVSHLGAIGLTASVLGFVGCFSAMLCAYFLARGGAGDVKLAAAIGALIGFEQGILAIGISYVLAGVGVLAWSICKQGPWRLLAALGRLLGSTAFPAWIEKPTSADNVILHKPIPLAGFFAIGTLIVVLEIV